MVIVERLRNLFHKLTGQHARRRRTAYSSSISEMNCLDLSRFSPEQLPVTDLRVMIRQGIGLEFVVPVALWHLERDPLVSGVCYPEGMHHAGDLLESVQGLPLEFWEKHPEMLARWQKVKVAIAKPPAGR